MLIYIFLFVLWGIFAFLLRPERMTLNQSQKIPYVIVSGISLVLVMSLRATSVGTDTMAYKFEFENAKNFLDERLRQSEIGYSYFNYFVHESGFNFQMYLAIISIIFIGSLSLIYIKFSENILLSFYLHVTIGAFAMSMTGIRQTLAIALTMISFYFLMKNKKIVFVLFVISATFFHNSAIFFLLILLLRKFKISKKNGWLIFILSSMTFVLNEYLLKILVFISPSSYAIYFNNSTNINPMLLIISMVIPLACLIFWPVNRNSMSMEKEHLYSITFLLVCLNYIVTILSQDISMLSRITSYLLVYSTILIPNIIFSIQSKHVRLIAKLACFIFPLIQFLLSTPGGSLGIDNYKFFWE